MTPTFRNWGRTVENEPAQILVPTTKKELCEIVKAAAAKGQTVRASGYRHSWSEIFSANGQVLVSMLDPSVVETIPAPEPEIDPDNELQGIKIVGKVTEEGVEKALCRIGAATTNEQFRRWCLKTKEAGSEEVGNWEWTVPFNVIMVEITWGGSNAPICHGAGSEHETLSDLVTEVEFVNAKGELQKVTDPNLLRSAAGCFGLLGVVTAITLKLDPMSYARLRPESRRIALTVPPPVNFKVPSQVNMGGITTKEMEEARTRFKEQCAHSYYAEWFWFPYQDEGWANCWNNDGAKAEAVDYPSPGDTILEEIEEALVGFMEESSPFKALSGQEQAEAFGDLAMGNMPSGTEIVTPVIDALHFRRGIQNFRCLDMELSIPLPVDGSGLAPEWGLCQRAWWDAIKCVYEEEEKEKAPMRVALEMRVMGGSKATMAPQAGNRWGTCAIEVLTSLDTPPSEWEAFTRKLAARWSSYTDNHGNALNVRPHWAKDWQHLEFRGGPAVPYLRSVAYAKSIPQLRADLEAVAKAGGYTLADLKLFSNPLLKELFGI